MAEAVDLDGQGVAVADHSQIQFLDHGQVAVLAEACGRYAVLVRFLTYTGLRWGEASALRVARLDLLRRRVTVAVAVSEVRGRAG